MVRRARLRECFFDLLNTKLPGPLVWGILDYG